MPDPRLFLDKSVKDIMTKNVAKVTVDDSISNAIDIMGRKKIGSVVVVSKNKVVGIITETDLLRYVADENDPRTHVKDVMTQPVLTIHPGMSILESGKLMKANDFRRLPVVEEEKLVGIVTETDVTRSMETSGLWKKLEDIMTKDVLTTSKKTKVAACAKLMVARKVGSIVVTEKEKVKGILTEKDILNKVLSKGLDPKKTPVSQVMTTSPITVETTMSVFSASRFMQDHRFRRLPVTKKGKLVGIVTQTDLSQAMSNVILEVVPKMESELKKTPLEHNLEDGMSYMIQEKKPIKSYEIFVDMVKHGHLGLALSRVNPERIRQEYVLEKTPLVWITEIDTVEKSIHPSRLQNITEVVTDYVHKVEKGVVFLEALSYLMNHNDFTQVLKTVQHLRDIISESSSCLIVYVDPIVLSEKELELLMNEMDEVKFRAY